MSYVCQWTVCSLGSRKWRCSSCMQRTDRRMDTHIWTAFPYRSCSAHRVIKNNPRKRVNYISVFLLNMKRACLTATVIEVYNTRLAFSQKEVSESMQHLEMSILKVNIFVTVSLITSYFCPHAGVLPEGVWHFAISICDLQILRGLILAVAFVLHSVH